MLAEVFNDTVFYFLEGVGLRNVSKSTLVSITYASGIVLAATTLSVLEWCYEIVLWTLHYLPMLWQCAYKEVQSSVGNNS